MPATTLRVKNLRQVNSALRKIDKGLAKTVRDAIKEAAEPVAAGARDRLSRYQGASTTTIRPRATGRSVFVTQYKKKVTGQRGDFGALTMREALLPALAEHEDEVREGVEQALDQLADGAGF